MFDTRRNRRRIFIFLGCILLSAFAWVLFSLSKSYTFTINRAISFTNFPEKRAVIIESPELFTFKLRGSGWNIIALRAGIRNPNPQFSLSDLILKKKKILLSDSIIHFRKYFPENVDLLSISPDTLPITFDVRSRKKVPIVLDTLVAFAKQFYYGEAIEIRPDSAWLIGNASEIDSITFIKTVPLQRTNVANNFTTNLLLEKSNPDITITPTNVDVTVQVQQFTENSILLPITIIGNRLDLIVNTYPSTVKVTYLVPLSKFESVKPEDFEVSVNINQWVKQKITLLPVSVIKQPDFIRITNITPSKVDFLVKK